MLFHGSAMRWHFKDTILAILDVVRIEAAFLIKNPICPWPSHPFHIQTNRENAACLCFELGIVVAECGGCADDRSDLKLLLCSVYILLTGSIIKSFLCDFCSFIMCTVALPFHSVHTHFSLS